MKLKALIAGIAGSFAISTAAMAADPIFIPPPASPPPMVAPVGFDWSGPYAGANVFFSTIAPGYAIGGQFGVNFARGNMVFGIEGVAFYSPTGTQFSIGGMGKAGFGLGATDRALIYGTAGAFYQFGAPNPFVFLFGGGVALGLGNSVSLFAEGLAAATSGTVFCCFIRAGVNFHFGN